METPNFSDFGDNLYRCKLTQENGVVMLVQRGWLYALVFLIFLTGIPMIIIIKENIEFSGFHSLLYLLAASGIILGVLYGAYKQEIVFDFGSKTYALMKGFPGFRQRQMGSFSNITAVTVREIRQTSVSSSSDSSTQTFVSWGIGLECTPASPTFEIWQADDPKKAEHMSKTLAAAFECKVVNQVSA